MNCEIISVIQRYDMRNKKMSYSMRALMLGTELEAVISEEVAEAIIKRSIADTAVPDMPEVLPEQTFSYGESYSTVFGGEEEVQVLPDQVFNEGTRQVSNEEVLARVASMKISGRSGVPSRTLGSQFIDEAGNPIIPQLMVSMGARVEASIIDDEEEIGEQL